MSSRVQKALQDYLVDRGTGRIDDYKRNAAVASELRSMIAEYIHARSEQIALTSNTSHGLNIIATGYPWERDDEILIPAGEFPANVYPFLNLEKLGVKVRRVPRHEGRITLTDFIELVNDQTRMVSLSYVQYLNGFRADLQSIGKFCHENNIAFVVDGIQGLGALPINVESAYIDALATGGQKWLMSPKGSGFLYVSERLFHKLDMNYLGWLSVKTPFDFQNYHQELNPSAQRFELATPNHLGIYGMNAALRLILEIGVNTIRDHLLEITGYLREKLRSRGCEIVTDFRDGERAGIMSFSCGSPDHNEELFKALLGKGVTISYRDGILRVSPHFYNTIEDMDRFLNALTDVS